MRARSYSSLSLFLQNIQQVGSDSPQGAGAPTMFQAIRRIVDSLSNGRSSENTYERAIRHSFLGMLFESSHYLGLEIRGR